MTKKALALWSISKGLRIPHQPLERISELSYLRDLLLQLDVDCVLDVGANRGQFACELRGLGYKGWIVSFEPISSEFEAMRGVFSGDPKWRGYQIALGALEGQLPISIPKLTVMSSFLKARNDGQETTQELVRVQRIDQIYPVLLAELGFVRPFLKMDTQGYDLEVFKGALGCANEIVGVQSELSVVPLYEDMPHYLEALSTYEAAGFVLYNLSVVNRVADGGLLELNCFMRRADEAPDH